MQNALAYARVSTKEQAEKGFSIPAQLKAVREYAKSHDFRISDEYVDRGESAKTADRPEFRNMIKRCQKDKTIDAVIVHKIDRFSRNNIDFYAYKGILKKGGIRIISVTENIEENPSGQFLENVVVAMAQFYSSNLAEEVLKGMKEKFRRGEWPVRAPIGYKNIKGERGHSQVMENKDTSYLIKQMFKLYSTAQYSLGSLSKEMARRGLKTKNDALLSEESIKRILQNRFYIGIMRMWDEEVKGKHKPLISESLFNQVQNIMEDRKITQDRWQKRDFLLRGLLYCHSCNQRSTAEVHPRGGYYRCPSRLNHKKCKEKYIPIKSLEGAVEKLYSLMEPPSELLKLLEAEIGEIHNNFKAKSQNELSNLKRKIRESESKMDALVDDLATRTITPDVYKKYSQKYEKEIKDAKDRLAVLEKDYSSNFDFIDKCMILASTLPHLHKKFSFRQRKNLARAIFKRIWVRDKKIKMIELNPPFGFLLKDQVKKINSVFPDIRFKLYPSNIAKKDIFEHLVDSINSPAFSLVLNLVKENEP